MFENALASVHRAAAVHAFDKDFLRLLEHPHREIRVSIPVKMDDGTLKVFEGYRVQYNNALGPYKGGIRYHEQVDISEVKALALLMAIKTATVNIGMGGGKGGVTVNPKTLSHNELEQLSRGWMRLMVRNVGPQIDVPAPDVNTTPQIMDWMADEYAKATADKSGAVITGKTLAAGGSEGRGTATAQGGFFLFEALREKLGLPEVCTVVVQGFGNAGRNAAEIWSAAGHKVIAVSDSQGAVYNQAGLDIQTLGRHKDETHRVTGASGAQSISPEELVGLECDVLIPSALEGMINEGNANNVRAKVVFELANGPITPAADDLLFKRGIPVVPDILANAGGVTVSTFEWEQNVKGEHWTREEVFAKLKTIMEREGLNVFETSRKLNTDLRRATFVIALQRIEAAMKK